MFSGSDVHVRVELNVILNGPTGGDSDELRSRTFVDLNL